MHFPFMLSYALNSTKTPITYHLHHSGPKRFRPPTREELQNEIANLKKEVNKKKTSNTSSEESKMNTTNENTPPVRKMSGITTESP